VPTATYLHPSPCVGSIHQYQRVSNQLKLPLRADSTGHRAQHKPPNERSSFCPDRLVAIHPTRHNSCLPQPLNPFDLVSASPQLPVQTASHRSIIIPYSCITPLDWPRCCTAMYRYNKWLMLPTHSTYSTPSIQLSQTQGTK
jgi:hypothetical protein